MDEMGRLFAFDNFFSNGQMKLPVGELIQVSELTVVQGGEILGHTQACDEITCVISGGARVYSGTECSVVKTGDVHFIRRGAYHRIEVTQEDNLRFLCIGYQPAMENETVAAFYEAVGNRTYFVTHDDGSIRSLSEFLVRELYNQDAFSFDMIDRYLTQILVMIDRIDAKKSFSVLPERSAPRLADYAMHKALRYIDAEYPQITNVKSISDALSYNEYYLSHLFREKMGVTIKSYVANKKLDRAAELLRTSALPVEQIAEQLHFASPHTFRRAFKSRFSASPTAYRKDDTARNGR